MIEIKITIETLAQKNRAIKEIETALKAVQNDYDVMMRAKDVIFELYKITPRELAAQSKTKGVVLARYFFYDYCRKHGITTKKIGESVNRDHSTVIAGTKTLQNLIRFCKETKKEYEKFNKQINKNETRSKS